MMRPIASSINFYSLKNSPFTFCVMLLFVLASCSKPEVKEPTNQHQVDNNHEEQDTVVPSIYPDCIENYDSTKTPMTGCGGWYEGYLFAKIDSNMVVRLTMSYDLLHELSDTCHEFSLPAKDISVDILVYDRDLNFIYMNVCGDVGSERGRIIKAYPLNNGKLMISRTQPVPGLNRFKGHVSAVLGDLQFSGPESFRFNFIEELVFWHVLTGGLAG